MKLDELLVGLSPFRLNGSGIASSLPVTGVTDDSRHVQPGDLFVAVRGFTVDGHDFVPTAIQHGAAAVVVDHALTLSKPVLQIVVPYTKVALGHFAACWHGNPADHMTLVGITGTNGKTTTTYLCESMLNQAGAQPGVIGTISYRFGGQTHPAPFTTPTPLTLHALFAEMHQAKTTHVIMETSSAALAMDRLAGITFRVAAFTNLTQDHLDIHRTMEEYADAKALLFRTSLSPQGCAVASIDDPHGATMLAHAPPTCRRLAVSATNNDRADVAVLRAHAALDGLCATVRTPRGSIDIETKYLLGTYNIANIAIAIAIGEALDLPQDAIARGIAHLRGVPGRIERIPHPDRAVFVDYAHTPDALERVIAALRPLLSPTGRLIVVFGCGGDRDKTKRPRMGAIAAKCADLVVVTSDNPRTEDPLVIIDMIFDGVKQIGKNNHLIEPDRHAAIRQAIQLAQPSDIVLIAGKGHEDYQILGTSKIHFDDREEAAAALVALGAPT